MKNTRPLILDESALTGIKEIDRQHQDLFNLVNDAYLALVKSEFHVNTRALVRELLGYAIYHFNTEETLMQEYAISQQERTEADEHIAQHRQFSQRILSLQEKLLKREYIDTQELLVFLTDWINDHVLNTDQALARLILNRHQQ